MKALQPANLLPIDCDSEPLIVVQILLNYIIYLAGVNGFEPLLTEPESVVLPLDDTPKR